MAQNLKDIDFNAAAGSEPDEVDIGSEASAGIALKDNSAGKSSAELSREAAAVSAKLDELIKSVVEKDDADHFDAAAFENITVELAQRNKGLQEALEFERRGSNDRDRESAGPVDLKDKDQVRADFIRGWEKAVGMCLEGEARSISLANRRFEIVDDGDVQNDRIALKSDRRGNLHLGEICQSYEDRAPTVYNGAVSATEMARFDSAIASTDAGAPLGIIYEEYAEEDRAFFGSLANPSVSDVWYRQERLDGAGRDLKDIDLPVRNKRLTAGQSTENEDMHEDDSTYDDVTFSANSIDLGRQIPNKYRQKTQIYNFMAQEMIPTMQAVERKCEELLLVGDGSRTTGGGSPVEGQPKGYWTALDALTGNDVSITRSTANTRAGFKGKVEDIEDTINKLDVGYRGYQSLSMVMHPDIWGYLSSLRSDQFREMAPFMDRVNESTRDFMLGIMGHFDGYVRILVHPNANTTLNAANNIAWSVGPTKAFRFVTTDIITVFSSETGVKKRGEYFAVYRYDDSDLSWTSVGAPVGILAKTA